MKYEIHLSDHVPKVALFASRLPHCLEDLLQRQQAGEFKAEIGVVVSNHPDAGEIAARYRVPSTRSLMPSSCRRTMTKTPKPMKGSVNFVQG